MSVLELLGAAAMVFVGSAVQGLAGFGAGLLAIPVVALFAPELIPGSMLMAVSAITVLGVRREHGDIEWGVVAWSMGGRLPGTVLGGMLLAAVSDTTLELLISVSVLVGVGLSFGGIRVTKRPATLVSAGVVSGVGATAAGIGGPPMALVLQHDEGPNVRATLSAMFMLLAPVSLITIAVAGRLDGGQFLAGLALMPAAAGGFFASSPLRSRVDRRGIRPLVLGLSTLAALVLLVRTLL
jgi:uncharacterized membrane protein YfcA